jgi:hypothetical protein
MAAPARPRRRRAVFAILLIVGLLMAAQILRMRVAEMAVREGNGQLAFAARPQNGWGAALWAESRLTARDVAGARSGAIIALQQTPYAVVALRTLARSLEQSNGPAAAEPAWLVASSLGWRDKPTQVWAVLRALSNGEADVFALRADALLRAPGDNRVMTALVRQAMVVPVIRDAFVARLARRPPWRGPFFDVDRPLGGKELEGTAIALAGLAGSGAEPRKQELRDAILGLIVEGRYDQAVDLDRRFVRRLADPGSLLDDGGFELSDTDYLRNVTPFDWTITEATATLDRSSGRRSMSVTTEGSRGLPAVTRHVALPAGAYRLSYQTQGDRLTPASIVILVKCVSSGALLGRSSPEPLTASDWQARAFEFTIPAGCPLVRIEVDEDASDPPVTAFIDNVMIARR